MYSRSATETPVPRLESVKEKVYNDPVRTKRRIKTGIKWEKYATCLTSTEFWIPSPIPDDRPSEGENGKTVRYITLAQTECVVWMLS